MKIEELGGGGVSRQAFSSYVKKKVEKVSI